MRKYRHCKTSWKIRRGIWFRNRRRYLSISTRLRTFRKRNTCWLSRPLTWETVCSPRKFRLKSWKTSFLNWRSSSNSWSNRLGNRKTKCNYHFKLIIYLEITKITRSRFCSRTLRSPMSPPRITKIPYRKSYSKSLIALRIKTKKTGTTLWPNSTKNTSPAYTKNQSPKKIKVFNYILRCRSHGQIDHSSRSFKRKLQGLQFKKNLTTREWNQKKNHGKCWVDFWS